MTDRQQMTAALPKPCSECPWRTANQGRRHAHGFYTKKNLQRLWAGLRRGERMTCHPTDPHMADFEGYEATAERPVTHECAGSLILTQRETQRFSDACAAAEGEGKTDGYARYRRAHPLGLLREGLAVVAGMFIVNYPGELPMAKANLNDTAISYPPLVEWEVRAADDPDGVAAERGQRPHYDNEGQEVR